MLTRTFPGYVPYCPYGGARLAEARRLVRASGTRGMRVKLWTVSTVPAHDSLRRICAWGTGIPGDRHTAPRFRAHLRPAGARRGPFPSILSGRRLGAPSDFLAKNLSCAVFSREPGRNNNLSEFCSRRIDAHMRRCERAQATNTARANRMWAAVDHELVEVQTPWVPLYNLRGLWMLLKRVGRTSITTPRTAA